MIREVPADPARRGSQLQEVGQLRVSSEREDDVHTIALAGELDLATVDRVARELERAEAGDALAIVLDLGGLTFMDSSGVRLLMQAAARSHADTGRLVVLGARPGAQRVFAICGVEGMLPFAG